MTKPHNPQRFTPFLRIIIDKNFILLLHNPILNSFSHLYYATKYFGNAKLDVLYDQIENQMQEIFFLFFFSFYFFFLFIYFFFFTSRRPRELILGMSKCVLHDSWIICTPFPSRMHIRKPHVKVACTHHVLGDITPSISKCGGPTGWGRSTYVRPIDSPHTFLLKK